MDIHKYTLELPCESNTELHDTANRLNLSIADTLSRALVLLNLASKADKVILRTDNKDCEVIIRKR